MDPFLGFFTWQFILFCLFISGITFVLRTFVEFFEKDMKDLKMWNELILPIFPVIVGGLIAIFVSMYPYPDGFGSNTARLIFGSVAGLLSTLVFRVIKSTLNAKISEEQEPTDLLKAVKESIKKEE